MKTTRFRSMQLALAVLTLVAASLACQMPTPVAPPTHQRGIVHHHTLRRRMGRCGSDNRESGRSGGSGL